MAEPYDVELTSVAEETYTRIYAEAQKSIADGDLGNSKVTLLKQVDEALDKLIPHDPFNPQRGLRGSLSNIFRISKGRMRICYMGSSKLRKIVVLYISESPRKEGDINDPYSVFTRMVLSGKFDDIFTRLGVRKPIRQAIELAMPLVQ